LLSQLQIHPSLGLPSSNLEASDPFHLTSFALALLLAFRLDASYSRYMEARSLWGDVVCDARNLMRQVCHTHGAQAQHADSLTAQQGSLIHLFCTFLKKNCILIFTSFVNPLKLYIRCRGSYNAF